MSFKSRGPAVRQAGVTAVPPFSSWTACGPAYSPASRCSSGISLCLLGVRKHYLCHSARGRPSRSARLTHVCSLGAHTRGKAGSLGSVGHSSASGIQTLSLPSPNSLLHGWDVLLELYRFQNAFFYISLFNRNSVTQNTNFAFVERGFFKYPPSTSQSL